MAARLRQSGPRDASLVWDNAGGETEFGIRGLVGVGIEERRWACASVAAYQPSQLSSSVSRVHVEA
ncbi:hypothetical protein VQ02_24915 [Methylobacterium variabile]|uniref:Uncharacterized protein n=1 Tax=Methylobacterium variabile TaxID=298794 RepID=A0A0J6SE65_9HYPH|nr:hypothetical protein VQ02_24915 [Methylobacterium variabile]